MITTAPASATPARARGRRPCVEPARHPVWRETRPGLIVHEHVCDAHLAGACYGYRTDDSPIPPPDAGDGQRSVT